MKKSTKIYLWAWAVAFVILTGYIVWPSHRELASDPDKIGAIVNLRLPDVVDSEYNDNFDRGTSHWDFYEYHAFFENNISEECIAEMERRCKEDSEHWSKDEEHGYYMYADTGGADDLYEVGCVIYKDQVHVGYLIDEDEGIFAIAVILLLGHILFWWGLVLLVLHLIRKNTAKQVKQHELEKHNEVE
jgi:hypothetical protein